MERVLIIGSGGAGKSTLALALARATGLPLIHLDREYWLPGWVAPDKADWASKVEALIARPRWIIDGNYGGTLPLRLTRADMVIFLDLPVWLCVYRAVARGLQSRHRDRPDMAPGCPEKIDFTFLRHVARFRGESRQRILRALDAYPGQIIALRTTAQVRAFVERAGAPAA